MAFNDASLLTATGNDVAFEEIFALPLERLARAGDLLIAISSSGNSPNIVRGPRRRAVDVRCQIVTLTGKRADNQARALGDLNFYVPRRPLRLGRVRAPADPALLARSVSEPVTAPARCDASS